MTPEEFEQALQSELKKFPCNIEEAGYNEDKELGFEEGARWAYDVMQQPNRTPTEDDLKALGFVLDHAYSHDKWKTAVYVKGELKAEFTYCGNVLETFEVYIEDSAHARPCTLSQLKVIAEVWG